LSYDEKTVLVSAPAVRDSKVDDEASDDDAPANDK
jgi:hypothetical protein